MSDGQKSSYNTITVKQGYEYKTYGTQSIYEKKEFFHPQYMQAVKCIDEITYEMWRHCEEARRNHDGVSGNYDDSEEIDLMGYSNNIIGLCAKRGQGKSSAMLSITRALKELSRENIDNDKKKLWNEARKKTLKQEESGNSAKYKQVYDTKYYVMKSVDPTTMEVDESILEIIISRLLQQVNQTRRGYIDPRDERNRENQYHDLLEAFQSVYRQVKRLKRLKNAGKYTDEYDDLTNIMEVADSRNIKYGFENMVRLFLQYMDNEMLVIPVDDSDLNPDRAYEIMEDLRKYCVIPRVMIIMAVHLGTLRTCIEQEFVRKYEKLLTCSLKTDHMESYRCKEMAERYIDKLIPGHHQIHLPYAGDKIRDGAENLKLRYVSAKNAKEDLLSVYKWPEKCEPLKDFEEAEAERYHDRLARMLFEKTGVVLVEKPGYLHNFMPRRFRELTHFLAFLWKLTDIKAGSEYPLKKLIQYSYFDGTMSDDEKKGCEEYIDRRIRNVDQLEMYFFQHWCPMILTKNQISKLEKIRTVPLSLKNKKTVEVLAEYCKEHEYECIKRVSFPDSHEVVTYADVMDALAETKKVLSSHFKFDFVYAIQMYYTIYMNKILCQCLKKPDRYFIDLYLLTKGVLYNVSKKNAFLVKKAGMEKIEAGTYREEITKWFIPCDIDGVVIDSVESEWMPEIAGSTLVFTDEYYRFDPHRWMLWAISSAKINGVQEDIEGPYDKRGFDKHLSIMADALYYITNFDLQYRAKKEGLYSVNADEIALMFKNVSKSVSQNYQTIRNVLNGYKIVNEHAETIYTKNNVKRYHYLPIRENSAELYTDSFGVMNSEEEKYTGMKTQCTSYRKQYEEQKDDSAAFATNVIPVGETLLLVLQKEKIDISALGIPEKIEKNEDAKALFNKIDDIERKIIEEETAAENWKSIESNIIWLDKERREKANNSENQAALEQKVLDAMQEALSVFVQKLKNTNTLTENNAASDGEPSEAGEEPQNP